MSLLFLEGWEDNLLSQKWTWVNNPGSIVTGRNGSGYQASSAASSSVNRFLKKRLEVADESATLITGFAWKCSSVATLQSLGSGVLSYYSDDGATQHFTLCVNAANFNVRRGDTGGAVLATSVQTFLANTWYYIESKVTLSDTVGAIEIRVNGVPWISLTGIDTKNGGTKTVFDSVALGYDYYNHYTYDDLYICNSAGAINNDFLGEILIETLFPTGDGSQSDLVGSDGNSVSNYALVNESVPDLATYVGSATTGQRDLYAMGDLSRTGGSIKGVQVTGYVAKSDTNPVSAKLPVARSGTVSGGPTRSITSAFGAGQVHTRVAETDPVTGAAFTVANVNALEAGFEVA